MPRKDVTRMAAKKKAPRNAAARARQEYEKAVKTSHPGDGKRAAALEKALKAQGVRDPGALIGAIGRKKYGNQRMAEMSAAGRKRAAASRRKKS